MRVPHILLLRCGLRWSQGTTHDDQPFDNLWDAIEDTPALAETLNLALKDHIAREGLTQSHAAKLFGVTQPRISLTSTITPQCPTKKEP
jgi:hypothetical protein